jgi:hypothetical protein
MPEGVEYDFASKNIVTQAVISPAYAPLSFTELQTGELYYSIWQDDRIPVKFAGWE